MAHSDENQEDLEDSLGFTMEKISFIAVKRFAMAKALFAITKRKHKEKMTRVFATTKKP